MELYRDKTRSLSIASKSHNSCRSDSIIRESEAEQIILFYFDSSFITTTKKILLHKQ